MSKQIALLLPLVLLAITANAAAQSSLFYLEAQGVAGYSSARDQGIFYSMDQDEVMQKPSLGFDYVQRFSKPAGDFAVLAVQARLAWNAKGGQTLEPQLYNAYLKLKFPWADIWAGHNRPAFGLSSVFDIHGQILPTLVMQGYGYDRDWGFGLSRDFSAGSWGISLTAGSGMPLRLKGNYLLSGRLTLGVLSRDNFSLGLSAAYGEGLETMGYHLMSSDHRPFRMIGADLTYLWNNIENRLEAVAGKKFGDNAWALFWRLGINLLAEDRLKWEVQPAIRREGADTRLEFSTGLAFLASSDLTLRIMYLYDQPTHDSRAVVQVYFYKRILS